MYNNKIQEEEEDLGEGEGAEMNLVFRYGELQVATEHPSERITQKASL